MSVFSLHCEKCLRDLNQPSDHAVQLVALFKPSRFGRMAKTHALEQRHRCLHCGFVNVFHPAEVFTSSAVAIGRAPSWRDVSIK